MRIRSTPVLIMVIVGGEILLLSAFILDNIIFPEPSPQQGLRWILSSEVSAHISFFLLIVFLMLIRKSKNRTNKSNQPKQ